MSVGPNPTDDRSIRLRSAKRQRQTGNERDAGSPALCRRQDEQAGRRRDAADQHGDVGVRGGAFIANIGPNGRTRVHLRRAQDHRIGGGLQIVTRPVITASPLRRSQPAVRRRRRAGDFTASSTPFRRHRRRPRSHRCKCRQQRYFTTVSGDVAFSVTTAAGNTTGVRRNDPTSSQ